MQLFVFVVISLFGYLYTDTQKKLLHVESTSQKCNPRYIFFSGFLNPLYKDPWSTTQSNFNRCVSKSVYKDPNLSKEIKRNEKYMKLHDGEIKENLSKGDEAIENIRKQWEEIIEKKDMEVQMLKSEAGGIFEKQGYMHNTIADTITQLFQVLKATIVYVQGILLYRISQHKEDLSVDKKHEEFMKKYSDIYNIYKKAFDELDKKHWSSSMNKARDAINQYDDLSYELENYMNDHFYQIADITESCYHLQYNLDDTSCEQIYPNMVIPLIDHYPILKNAFKI